MKGYVQVYTGDGKGKTTAAFGLAIRAAGSGLKVWIGQIRKKGEYSEIHSMQRFADLVTVEQFGTGKFVMGKPSGEDIQAAATALSRAEQIMSSGKADVVILDEANVALACGLFSAERLLALIRQKPEEMELVLTGRGAAPEIIEAADLVTEMKCIKHYHEKGVMARTGIEK
jgi:cob(I)alamin adenosyltransferase